MGKDPQGSVRERVIIAVVIIVAAALLGGLFWSLGLYCIDEVGERLVEEDTKEAIAARFWWGLLGGGVVGFFCSLPVLVPRRGD